MGASSSQLDAQLDEEDEVVCPYEPAVGTNNLPPVHAVMLLLSEFRAERSRIGVLKFLRVCVQFLQSSTKFTPSAAETTPAADFVVTPTEVKLWYK